MLLAPSRPIRIVYATQRPLTPPRFRRPLILPRDPDSTTAVMADDSFEFDAPSTGRVDVYARWQLKSSGLTIIRTEEQQEIPFLIKYLNLVERSVRYIDVVIGIHADPPRPGKCAWSRAMFSYNAGFTGPGIESLHPEVHAVYDIEITG